MNANLRFIEIMLTILDRGGGRFDFATTERRARVLASRLVERADRSQLLPAQERASARPGCRGNPDRGCRGSLTVRQRC